MKSSLLRPIFNHFGIFFCPMFDPVEDEAEDVCCLDGSETSCCGGTGRSVAWERTDDESGAGILDPTLAILNSASLQRG
jgi:hypothetical protein